MAAELMDAQPLSLAFSNIKCAVVAKKKETKRDKRDKLRGRDYKRLVTKVEKIYQRLDSIKEKNPEKAKRVQNSMKWDRAMRRAQGEKIKDDASLLRKSLKKKLKAKEKHKRVWNERSRQTESKIAKRQQKRNANIEKRKSKKKKR